MTDALALHILERLTDPPTTVDQKGRFGKFENQAPQYSRSKDVPEFVRENLPAVARREFALTPPATPEDQPAIRESDYRQFWIRALRPPWNIYEIAEDMAATFDINPGWAFKHVRQHLNQLVLQARMRGYREETLIGRRFRWTGPEADHPACQWIQGQIPEEGVQFKRLVELMQEAKQRFVEDPPSSPHVVHDWCRHEIAEVR